MSANKIRRFGPIALSTTIADLLSPPVLDLTDSVGITETDTYILIRHLRFTNKSASPVSYTLYIGLSEEEVDGTEFAGAAKMIDGNGSDDYFSPGTRLEVGQFLTGKASSAAAITVSGEIEIGIK